MKHYLFRLCALLVFSLLIGCSEKKPPQEAKPVDSYQEAVKRLQTTKSSKDPKELFDAVANFGKAIREKRLSEISPVEKEKVKSDYFTLAVPLLLSSAEMGSIEAKLVLARFLEKGVEPELKADPEKAHRYQSDIDASDDPVIILLGEKYNKCNEKDDLLPEKYKRLELAASKGLSLARWKIAKCHLDVTYAIYKKKDQEYIDRYHKKMTEYRTKFDAAYAPYRSRNGAESFLRISEKFSPIMEEAEWIDKEKKRELHSLSREFRDALRMIEGIPATKDSPELMARYDAIRFAKDPRSKNPYEDDLHRIKRDIFFVLSMLAYGYEIGEATSDSSSIAAKLAMELASKGDAHAQRNLGHWFINGYGVPKGG